MSLIHHREAASRHRRLLRAIGDDCRRLREDAGESQTAVARAAGVAQAYLSAIEAGEAEPSLAILGRVGAALGTDLSVHFFQNTGPRLRDRIQLMMEQAVLEHASPRWRPELEVRVYRPVRGVVDVLLHDKTGPDSVATEAHSLLRRVEQQLRWANQKADALAALPGFDDRRICRLLLLRNTAANRELVRTVPAVFTAAYPARSSVAFEALRSATGSFPVAALLWVDVVGNSARLLPTPPRGIQIGR
jgi:transcriptional regulator with XRE-family HTH domain